MTDDSLPLTSGAIDVEGYETFEAVGFMQKEWDNFIESINGEIFLTYDWCRIWWKYYGKGRHLKIFIFRENGRLVGLLPLFRDVIGLWPMNMRVIKIVGTDFMPVTVNIPIKKDQLNDIIKSMLNSLSKTWRWDMLYLGAICGKCEIVERLEKACIDALSTSCSVSTRISDVQTYFKVADSMEKQVASLNKAKRKRFRHYYENKEESGITVAEYATVNNFDTYFNAFVNMHQSKWQKDGQAGHFGDWPDSLNFHHEVALTQLKHDRLRLLRIKIADQEAGYQYSYKFGDTYYMFLNARVEEEKFKNLNYYTLLICEDARRAMTENVKYFDAMRGRYEYKLQSGGYLLPVSNLYISSRRQPISKIRISTFRTMFSLLDILYVKIWRRRVLPKLGIRPSPFNKFWIKTHMLSA